MTGLSNLRIAFLTNLISPYQKPLLDCLARRYGRFCVFLSTPMEANRQWPIDWKGLDVVVQKNVTITRRWRHKAGFSEPNYIHLPLDTFSQLKRYGPEVVISVELGVRTLLAIFYRLLNKRSRLLVSLDVSELTECHRGRLRRLLRRPMHGPVDAFLVNGESAARYLRGLGVSGEKIFRIAFATDSRRFGTLPLARVAGPARRLLYVGQLIQRKGLVPFLNAVAKWAALHPDCEVEWTVAGEGPELGALQATKIPDNLGLRFPGHLPPDGLPAIYAQAEIFVFPTFVDSWGVVVNEAMAAGLPVLGSIYSQAVTELVDDGVNGWTFCPDGEDGMIRALNDSLSTPPDELAKMRERARAAALAFTPEHVADLFEIAISAVMTEQAPVLQHS